jgi:hypothetical protein
MRETERTSMRLPRPLGATRTTTSSRKPNHGVVAVASIRPAPASAAMIVHPAARAAASAFAKAASGASARTTGAMSG